MENEQDFGKVLRRRRELLGYSVERVASATNIRANMLREFEAADFAHLPPKGYAVGILSSYSRYLGLDSDELLGLYEAGLAEYESPSSSALNGARSSSDSVHSRARRERARRAESDRSSRRRTSSEDPPIASGREAVSTGVAPFEIHWKMGLLIGAIVAIVGLGVWALFALPGRQTETPPLPVTPAAPSDETSETVEPGEPAPGEGTTVDVPAKGEPFTISVQVPAGVASWVEVRVDGATGYIGTLVGPATKEFEVADSLDLLVGKPGEIVVTKDGEPVELPIENHAGVLKITVGE